MSKAEIITLRVVAFLIVFGGTIVVINYLMSANPFYVAHDVNTNIKVWDDINGDGKRDSNEHFLSNVCVWAGYASEFSNWQKLCENQYFLTDKNGEWSDFFAGGSCNEIYNAANPPIGYHPTTPIIVNGCSAEFGFRQSDAANKIKLVDVGKFLQEINDRESKKEEIVLWLQIAIGVILISVFAGFVSFKITSQLKAKTG